MDIIIDSRDRGKALGLEITVKTSDGSKIAQFRQFINSYRVSINFDESGNTNLPKPLREFCQCSEDEMKSQMYKDSIEMADYMMQKFSAGQVIDNTIELKA